MSTTRQALAAVVVAFAAAACAGCGSGTESKASNRSSLTTVPTASTSRSTVARTAPQKRAHRVVRHRAIVSSPRTATPAARCDTAQGCGRSTSSGPVKASGCAPGSRAACGQGTGVVNSDVAACSPGQSEREGCEPTTSGPSQPPVAGPGPGRWLGERV